MQTLKLDIPDNKIDIVLNIIKNLKDDVVNNFELIDKNLEQDPYFYERRKQLHILHDNIKNGKEQSYDFDTSIDELIAELEK